MRESDQFLNTAVSEGSVVMRLRYGEIFDNNFVPQSLLSLNLKVKKNENRRTLILPKLWARIVSF